jgi:hypothetical protein
MPRPRLFGGALILRWGIVVNYQRANMSTAYLLFRDLNRTFQGSNLQSVLTFPGPR